MVEDREACLTILDEVGLDERTRAHVLAVERLARRLAARADEVDERVVQAGALLHDVGRAVTHGIDHVPEGVALLEARGVDERVIDCVATHVGAGIEPEQAQAWGWPKRRYVPERLEERIVAHADNLTFGTAYGRLADVEDKLASQDLDEVAERVRELHEDLEAQLGVDPDEVAASTRPPADD